MVDNVRSAVNTDGDPGSALARLRTSWEAFGATDPLWAILTDPDKRGGRWDAEAFFASGEVVIEWLLKMLHEEGVGLPRGRALDFGCGVGRLTQPLCEHFETVDGVDIAESMIDLARRYNRHGESCCYHVNDAPDLKIFQDNTFDLVLSLIVLQHIEPDLSLGYIREFIRVLRRGGLAVFQAPYEYRPEKIERLPEGTHNAGIELAPPSLKVLPGVRIELMATVSNRSPWPWPRGPRVRLGNHWLTSRGQMVQFDDGRVSLLDDVQPGGQASLRLVVTAPSKPGRYLLELDLVEEGVAWFAAKGSTTLRMPAVVHRTTRLPGLLGRLLVRSDAHDRAVRLDEPPPEPVMDMHCLPIAAVCAAVAEAGGRLLTTRAVSMTGTEWESLLYLVTKD